MIQLGEVLTEVEKNVDVKAIVITGSDRAFAGEVQSEYVLCLIISGGRLARQFNPLCMVLDLNICLLIDK